MLPRYSKLGVVQYINTKSNLTFDIENNAETTQHVYPYFFPFHLHWILNICFLFPMLVPVTYFKQVGTGAMKGNAHKNTCLEHFTGKQLNWHKPLV